MNNKSIPLENSCQSVNSGFTHQSFFPKIFCQLHEQTKKMSEKMGNSNQCNAQIKKKIVHLPSFWGLR